MIENALSKLTEDEAVEIMSKAMFEHSLAEAIKHVERIELPYDRVNDILTLLKTESDRSVAILLFSLIDDLLKDVFYRELNPEIKSTIKKLFSATGGLATASSRLDLAYGLNWLEIETYNNIKLIKKIRNEFAHNVSIRSFDTEPVRGLIASLDSIESYILHKPEVRECFEKPDLTTFRAKFIVRTILYAKRLVDCTVVMPIARRHSIDYRAILSAKNMPRNIDNFTRMIITHLVRFIREQQS